MNFKAEFSMDNAAFQFPHEQVEVRSVLTHIGNAMAVGMRKGVIRGSNGNNVGTWRVEE